VVLMGMGEPLYNFDNVKDAMEIVSDGEGISLSKRRITLSTSGVVPEIPRAGEEIGTMLAISLHGTTDEIRDKLVPLNKKYPIKELLEACRKYPGLSNARRITFEYVMLKDINDTAAHARALIRLVKDIPCKFNLIPFNPFPEAGLLRSPPARIKAFAQRLSDAGIVTTGVESRGGSKRTVTRARQRSAPPLMPLVNFSSRH
jgi:23S rRNA (adenine2503-C2)-methyltransferase